MANYSSVDDVIAVAKIYTRGSSFYDYAVGPPVVPATNPTLTEVETWLTQISSLMDAALADCWFITPVTAAKVVDIIDLQVAALVGDLCAYANQKGRLYSDRTIQIGAFAVLENDITNWVQKWCKGFENLGAAKEDQEAGAQQTAYSVQVARQVDD